VSLTKDDQHEAQSLSPGAQSQYARPRRAPHEHAAAEDGVQDAGPGEMESELTPRNEECCALLRPSPEGRPEVGPAGSRRRHAARGGFTRSDRR
jgi:hypothetical protein